MSNTTDTIHRYLFSEAPIRGELIQLQETVKQSLRHHDYPERIDMLLGELLAATNLLSATLKFEGQITLQLQSEGPVKLAVVSSTHQHQVRAVAQFDEQAVQQLTHATPLPQLFKAGQLVITITPDAGQKYQGVVALDQANLAACLEQYFEQSEQLKTRIWLFSKNNKAAGMMLQALPEHQDGLEQQNQYFEHLETLTNTITEEEIFNLDAHDLLVRLYHEEKVELFEPDNVSFQCNCSNERSQATIKQLGESEAKSILEEHTEIVMQCEFCGQSYKFDAVDVAAIFSDAQASTHHKH